MFSDYLSGMKGCIGENEIGYDLGALSLNQLVPEKILPGEYHSCSQEFYELGAKVVDSAINNSTAVMNGVNSTIAQSPDAPAWAPVFAITGLLAVAYLVLRNRD